MTIIVFTGPTLPPAEAAKLLDAVYLPPAAIGDVYRAAQRRPHAIGIIDGFFESIPSVWHKEVLWAMAQGIRVFGAASMGALRAAELAAFGMVGVGAVFEAYRDGVIEDDDEVAVVHGPAELGYPQLSEAMVNIRATLRKASTAGVVTPATEAALIDIGKSLFYKQRNYKRLLAAAGQSTLPGDELTRLQAWLPQNQVNQKRLDAIALLRAVAVVRDDAGAPSPASYVFEHTMLWASVERQFSAPPDEKPDAPAAGDRDELIEELRLDRRSYTQARHAALIRVVAQREADQQGMRPTVPQLQEATRRFCRRLGIQNESKLQEWLREQELTRDQFLQVMADAARLQWLEHSLMSAVDHAMADALRASGDYARLAARARDKREVLGARGIDEPTLSDAGLTEPQLLAWFSQERMPEMGDGDAADHAARLGFADQREFMRALLRDYCYQAWKDS